jgi:hypothetical protein
MSKVAIIGSGFVGRAWAIGFPRAGHDVALWDQDPQASEKALTYIRGLLPDLEASDLRSFPAAGLKGLPDGATVDAEGFVWSASVYEGKLDRVVGLPVESTTSLSFGGPGLDVAYVTSMARAVKGVKPKEREAGALFAIHGLGVRGLPEPRFAG